MYVTYSLICSYDTDWRCTLPIRSSAVMTPIEDVGYLFALTSGMTPIEDVRYLYFIGYKVNKKVYKV